MIDLDNIDDAKAILKKWCDDGMESISTPIRYEQLLGLMNNLAAAEKDAARYRWLRDESAFTRENAPLVFFTDTNGDQIAFDFNGSSYSVLHEEMLDAAIDEAMQCK